MKKILIENEEYTLEYTFEAAEYKSVVQKMFNMASMSFVGKRLDLEGENSKAEIAAAMIDGTGEMLSEIPHVCKDAFYAGLLEHHNVDYEKSQDLMKQYMKERKLSYKKLYEEIKEIMEKDGFFDLTGLTEMVGEMNKSAKETEEETEPEKTPKVPQDHKKSTSMK